VIIAFDSDSKIILIFTSHHMEKTEAGPKGLYSVSQKNSPPKNFLRYFLTWWTL